MKTVLAWVVMVAVFLGLSWILSFAFTISPFWVAFLLGILGMSAIIGGFALLIWAMITLFEKYL